MKLKIEDHFIFKKELNKIMVCTPDSFLHYLNTEVVKASFEEKYIKGYRVVVDFAYISEEENEKKEKLYF